MQPQGMIDAKQLEELADAGEIDTVLCMFTDFQGRFVGKRILPHFFLEDVMGEEGLHACLYLIAIDMEMEPLPGFEYASWETGYGDFKMIPDMSTMRLVPWLEKTAMVICDVADEHTSELVEVAPRTILRRQVERAKAAGYTFKTGSELEFYLFKESYEEAAPKRYQDLQPSAPRTSWTTTCSQTTKDEWLIRQIRNGMLRRGHPDRVLEGRVRRGPARDQHHLRGRAGDRRLPRALQARHEGDRRAERRRDHVHGEVDDGRGRLLVPHALERLERGRERVADVGRRRPEPHVPRPSSHMLGGLMSTAREMAWMYAPFVNSYKRYQLGSWAPTAILWSHDNRTCGFRVVGEHHGNRVESRLPGGDVNPYLGYAATIAAACTGSRTRSSARRCSRGTPTSRRTPSACRPRSTRRSTRWSAPR